MQQIYYCPNCKAKIDFGTKLCVDCGTPLNWNQFKPPADPTPPHQYQQQVPPNNQQNAPPQYQQQRYGYQEQYNRQQPRKRGMSLGLIVLLCFAGLIVFGGIIWVISGGVSNTPSPSSQVNSSPLQTTSSATTTTPSPSAIIITAAQLYTEYDANQAAADAKYRDKIINVTGIVNDIGILAVDPPYVVLTGGRQYELFGVKCLFSTKDEPKLAQLWEGQSLAIQGTCQGYWLDVILRNCSIK